MILLRLKKFLVTAFLVVIFSCTLHAQFKAITTASRNHEQFEGHLAISKAGLLLYGWDNATILRLEHLDTNLQLLNTWFVHVADKIPRTRLLSASYDDIGYRVVFHFLIKDYTSEIQVLDLETGSIQKKEWTLPFGGSSFGKFHFVHDEIWFDLSINKKYSLYRVGMEDLELREFHPKLPYAKYTLDRIQVLNNKQVALGYSYDSMGRFGSDIAILDLSGIVIDPGIFGQLKYAERNQFFTCNIKVLNDTQYLLSGTYHMRGFGYNQGLFFVQYNSGALGKINKYPHYEIPGIWDYLDPPDRKYAMENVAKLTAKGKDIYTGLFCNMHEPFATDDGYVVVCEFNARSEGSEKERDFYQLHGVVLSAEGEMTNAFSIPQYKKGLFPAGEYILNQTPVEDQLLLSQITENTAYITRIAENRVLGSKQQALSLRKYCPKNRSFHADAIPWYGPYYLLFDALDYSVSKPETRDDHFLILQKALLDDE